MLGLYYLVNIHRKIELFSSDHQGKIQTRDHEERMK